MEQFWLVILPKQEVLIFVLRVGGGQVSFGSVCRVPLLALSSFQIRSPCFLFSFSVLFVCFFLHPEVLLEHLVQARHRSGLWGEHGEPSQPLPVELTPRWTENMGTCDLGASPWPSSTVGTQLISFKTSLVRRWECPLSLPALVFQQMLWLRAEMSLAWLELLHSV